MINALLASNALWYPLRYPAEYAGGGTINEVIHYHYPTGDDMAQILSLNNFRDFGGGSVYDAAFGFLDQNPHNTMHIWTGGHESGRRSDHRQGAAELRVRRSGRAAASPPAVPAAIAATQRHDGIADRKFHHREDLLFAAAATATCSAT